MAKFSFFKPWTWFENKKEKVSDTTPKTQVHGDVVYKNLYYTGTSVVIVFSDGSVIMKNGVDNKTIAMINNCTTRQQIESLLTAPASQEPVSKNNVTVETQKERKTIVDNLSILRDNEDFLVNAEGQVLLKDVSLELPAVVAGSFIELLERIENIQKNIDKDAFVEDTLDDAVQEIDELAEQYEALKMFWYWTAMNPIESARKDLFNFIRKNDITLTSNGLLMMYRRIVTVTTDNNKNKELVEFISNSYMKVKKWKKAARNFEVFNDNGYVLVAYDKQNHGCNNHIGNLQDLYTNLSNLQADRLYTDNHTGKKDIKIGSIYKEDEDRIDLDNTKNCSKGLHVGSKSFGFGGFGDTGVLCLVNPMYVRSVPISETNKMRVSEMFVAGEMGIEEYSQNIENQAVADFSDEYCSNTIQSLRDTVSKKCWSTLNCQENKPAVQAKDIPSILKHIEERVMEVI